MRGPSALTAATVLADHGVACRVVGAGPGPTTQSRALVVQSRTLELWHKLGLADGARALLHGTDRAFGIIVSTSRAVRWGRKVAVHAVPRVLRLLPADARRLFAMVSQIGITYAGAAPAADPGGPVPRAGDRAPHAVFAAGPNAGRSVLDLFGGPGHHLLVLPAAQADLGAALVAVKAQLGRFALDVDVHVVDADETAIHRAYGARRPSLALVRPDGYLAWRGPLDAAERLGAHLSRWYTTAEEIS